MNILQTTYERGLSFIVVFMIWSLGHAQINVKFSNDVQTHYFPLNKVSEALPADWTSYNFISLEIRSSTPQRMELILITDKDTLYKRIHPLQNTWYRLGVPIGFYRAQPTSGHDMAATWNQPRKTGFINVEQGGFGKVNKVKAIGIRFKIPLNNPTVEIRNFKLMITDPGDEVLEPRKVVDEYGQWIPGEWPGKIKSFGQLQTEWQQEKNNLKAGEYNYSKYGGYLNSKVNATGFFRVEKVGNRWWFVDPDGHLFLSTGSNGMSPGSSTPTANRENFFEVLPPDEFRNSSKTNANFHAWNLKRRFGDDYRKQWAQMALDRIDSWGLTTIANWSDPLLWSLQKKPYVIFMRGWGIEQGVMGLADIYVPGYEQFADSVAASQCAARKNDPWLIGYFLGNEPPWPEREGLVAEKILSGAQTPIKKALQIFLAGGDTPERRRAFVHQTFEKFLGILNAAVKKHDPNHLNLGIRFGGTPPEALIKMARSFDVYSFNIYAYAVSHLYLNKLAQLTDKPMLIGEYHFGTPGRGMAAGLGQVADQHERGVAYRFYTENAFAHPNMVGTYWFTWCDQPNTGRGDGENYNIGLVDVTDRPYPDLIKGIVDTHKRLYKVHIGELPPFNEMPLGAIEPDYPAHLLKEK